MWRIAVLAASASCAAATKFEVMHTDAARGAGVLGGSGSNRGKGYGVMWPQGVVNVFIDEASLYDVELERVNAAIADVESKTCIQFNRCENRWLCPKPWVWVRHEQGCSSAIGVDATQTGQVLRLMQLCPLSTVIHELGHALGLAHEHQRNDRDEYLKMNWDNIKTDHVSQKQFQIGDPFGRDIGVFDYNSVMLYPKESYARSRKIGSYSVPEGVVVPPQTTLSPGDAAVLDWMYHGCSAEFVRPSCISSKPAVQAVAVGATFRVEFNGLYASGKHMQVEYTTTFPAERLAVTLPEGQQTDAIAKTVASFTPTAADEGATHVIRATFVGFSAAGDREEVCVVEAAIRIGSGDVPPTPAITFPPTPATAPPALPTSIPPTLAPPTPAPEPVLTPAPTTEAPQPTQGTDLTLKVHYGRTVAAQLGTITDGYSTYPSRTDKYVRVEGQDCLLMWTAMDMEYSSGCKYDFVSVQGAGASEVKFCGSTLPEPLQLAGTGFTVLLHSDGSVQKSGFELEFVCAGSMEPTPETPTSVPETPVPVRETPEPVPETPEPVPETPAPSPCSDKASWCEEYAEAEWCERHPSIMTTYCPKTCSLC